MKDDSLEVLLQRQRNQILDYVSGEEEQEEMQRTVSEVWAHVRRMEKCLEQFEKTLGAATSERLQLEP